MRRTARSCPTMRAESRSSKSWARGLFCSGSRKTVPMVLFSLSNSISEIMLVLLACARAFYRCPLVARPLLTAFINARHDPLNILMRRLLDSFAFYGCCGQLRDNDRCYIYDTR